MFKTADRKRESTQERTAKTIVLANVAYTEQTKTAGCLSQKGDLLRTQPNHKSLHIHSFNTPKCFMKMTAINDVLYRTKFELAAEFIWTRKKLEH